MTELKQPSFPVPKVLWEELENTLMIKSKELVFDIAKTLRVDGNPLWKEFRAQKTHLFLIDSPSEIEEHSCKATLCNSKVAQKCRKPTMFGKWYCPDHEYYVPSEDFKKKPQLQRIPEAEEPLFLDCLTQQVYNENYERVGYIMNQKCFVFEMEG
jgi:hypothetical protein